MKKFAGFLLAAIAAALLALPASAQYAVLPYPSPVPMFAGPWDASQGMGMMNQLIATLDNFLTPLFPNVPGATNQVQFLGGTSGNPATLTTTQGALNISPANNGNIILFPTNGAGTGLLQIASSALWYPAQGLAACPGTPAGRGNQGSLLGPASVVTGYMPILDWLGRVRWQMAC